MADIAHRLTDEKLEEMEKRLYAIYSRAEKNIQKKMADYAKSIDEKSAELLQAYKDAETEDEKRKAKKEYIRFYRKLVKSKEFVSLAAAVADDLYKANVEASAYINSQTPSIYALNYNYINAEIAKDIDGFTPQEITEAEYNTLLSEIREKTPLVDKLYSGEITIDAVPAEWQEEIQRRADERIAAEGIAEEQDISAEEALDILLGGAT